MEGSEPRLNGRDRPAGISAYSFDPDGGQWISLPPGRRGARPRADIAWSYPDPPKDAVPVHDLVALFSERLDVAVDGELQSRPTTPWSYRVAGAALDAMRPCGREGADLRRPDAFRRGGDGPSLSA